MTRFSVHSRPAWKLIALGGSLTFLLTLYTMHPSSAPLKQSLYGMFNQAPLEVVHTSTGCTPQQWSAGQWRSIPPRAKPEVTRPEDVLALDGFEGCAADREYYWHLGAEQDQWSRFPDVASYVWTPPGECNARPLEKEEMVRDMVEEGGWLLVGGEYTLRTCLLCGPLPFRCPSSSSSLSRLLPRVFSPPPKFPSMALALRGPVARRTNPASGPSIFPDPVSVFAITHCTTTTRQDTASDAPLRIYRHDVWAKPQDQDAHLLPCDA